MNGYATCPECEPDNPAARVADRCLFHDPAVERVYALMNDHGWADHYRCGWDGDEPPDDGMCGKEYAERESVREIVACASAEAHAHG